MSEAHGMTNDASPLALKAGPQLPIERQLVDVETEIAAIRARLAVLEAAHENALLKWNRSALPPRSVQPEDLQMQLFVHGTREDSKKVILPKLKHGFKASLSDIPIPKKVDDAIKAYRYIPYTALTHDAKYRAALGEEEHIISANGNLDRRNERLISEYDWYTASRDAERCTRIHHGNERADALVAHHNLVLELSMSHSWELAMEYDIQQRELAAIHFEHDLGGLDFVTLSSITLRMASRTVPAQGTAHSTSLSKRQRNDTGDNTSYPPRKKTRNPSFRHGTKRS